MEVEKRGVKGGFFQLFDWNAKSRKKLFSKKSDVADSSNSEKENYRSSLIPQTQSEHQKGYLPKAESESSYHYGSPSNADSEYGTKAPGVVARLMGLDSLPSNVNEPYLSPFLEPNFFRDTSSLMAPPVFPSEHDIVIFESVRNKLDGFRKNPLEFGLKKVPSRPIERFQTESLPPKSAKPVPLSPHRLLSPIKSPGFIPPKNAAYIIEAATKMIEQSPRSTIKGYAPSAGSSVTLRTRDLKERMEGVERSSRTLGTYHKGKELNSSRNMKNQFSSSVQERPEHNFRSSERSRMKEKAADSLVAQAKTQNQRRNGSVSVCSRSSGKQKEHSDVKLASSSRNHLRDPRKRVKKHTSSRSSDALRLNNQKQNSASEGNNSYESPCCHPKMRKESSLSTDSSQGRTDRTIDKIVTSNFVTSRKMNIVGTDPGKQPLPSSSKTSCKKRLPIGGNIQTTGHAAQKATGMRGENSYKFDSLDGDSDWDGIEKKKNLDVVSFTFTSPIKKSSGTGLGFPDTVSASGSSSFPNDASLGHDTDPNTSSASYSGINALGGDALSLLLEQKLRELTCNLSQEGQSDVLVPSGGSGEALSSPNSVNCMQKDNDTYISKQEIQNSFVDCPSISIPWSVIGEEDKMFFPGALESFQASHTFSGQPFFYGAPSESLEADECSIEGLNSYLSFDASHEETNFSATRKSGDNENFDTASSISMGAPSETATSCSYMVNPTESSNWHLSYIGDVLGDPEIIDRLALEQAGAITTCDIFDQLEYQKKHHPLYNAEALLERRVVFDCVCKCLEAKVGGVLSRGYGVWARKTSMLCRREWLAEEVYREISGWENEEEKMVDELVDRDMSLGDGRWVDFESEAFESGLEVEESVVSDLVDELVEEYLRQTR